MSRWWMLAFPVPFLNLWLGYRCYVCPSGYAQHKKLDGPGIALAILFWIMVLAGVTFIAVALAPLVGSMEGIKIPAELRMLIRKFSA
jgi:hypothetical protein